MIEGVFKKFQIPFLDGGSITIKADPSKMRETLEEILSNPKSQFLRWHVATLIINQNCEGEFSPTNMRSISSNIDWLNITIFDDIGQEFRFYNPPEKWIHPQAVCWCGYVDPAGRMYAKCPDHSN